MIQLLSKHYNDNVISCGQLANWFMRLKIQTSFTKILIIIAIATAKSFEEQPHIPRMCEDDEYFTHI